MNQLQWFYQKADGSPVGPLSGEQFVAAVKAGRIGEETLVGTAEPEQQPHAWIPAREAPAFHSAVQPAKSWAAQVMFVLGALLLVLGLLQWIMVDARPHARLPGVLSWLLLLAAALFFALQRIIVRLDKLLWLVRHRK